MLLRADSLASTHAIAAVLAGLSRPGDMIVLAGEMGAGKTAFAQGFGRAMGVAEPITSPTFTLVHSYPCPDKITLHHADLYRLDRMVDVEELALHELAEFRGIVLIEWGDVASSGLGEHLEVRLRTDDGDGDADDSDGGEPTDAVVDDFGLDDVRLIELHATGQSWAGRWDRIAADLHDFRWAS